ncbi:DUF3040 domain-containing protein [Austwickia chelonae]|uniref:DUF3040 domain-containing protein n=1 Tax=Austwickia chelonae TaxID=100225 RepID=UPI001966D0FA|nr:DUF3040 domain-containing protein [Austwickia chelonae]
MPLSEHEQKLLDQMERALYAEDPSFATQMKGTGRSVSRMRLVWGAIAAVVGLGVVLLGVNLMSIPVGVLGFTMMVAGVIWAVTPRRGGDKGLAGPGAAAKSPRFAEKKNAKKRLDFMNRLDARWERRRHEGGR